MSYPNMPNPRTARLVRHFIAPTQDPARIGQFDFIAVYSAPEGGQFTVVIPKREPTEQEVDNVIREDYLKQKRFINREINL